MAIAKCKPCSPPLGVARGLLQERPLQFQHGNVHVKSWQPMSNSWSTSSQQDFVRALGWRKNCTKSPGQDFVHRVAQKLVNSWSIHCPFLRTLFPLTAFKDAANPKFVQNLSRRLFFGVPIRGARIYLSGNCHSSNFRQIFDKFGSPSLEHPKTIVRTILDKFGVRGVFETCKGKRGQLID